MNDELEKLIREWFVAKSEETCHEFAQRLHEAGYRKMPSVERLTMRIEALGTTAYYHPSIGAKAIHDLMDGGE